MKHLFIRVQAESPLAIRSDHAPGGAAGVRYIPGPTFVGGLTALYRQLNEGDTKAMDLFAPLFLNEQVLYPNLYPAVFDDLNLQDQDSPVYPIPKTAQSCKRHSGFRLPDNKKNDAHGVRDTAIDWALFKLANTQEQKLAILQAGKDCHQCEESMDHLEGYYRRHDIKTSQMIAAQPDNYNRLQTRTGVHRQSGTVQDGILYNRQVFEEGMLFCGEAIFPDDDKLLDGFTDFISEIGPEGLLRLGTGRTRGMGKVTLKVVDLGSDQQRFTAFSKRLEDFNKVLKERAEHFKQGSLPYSYFFALTLHSPLILLDDLLRYRGVIDVGVLKELLGCEVPEGLDLIYYSADVQRVTGWQELWGTPRTAEYAIEMGSVFLFACKASSNVAMLNALFALEEKGVGKRCTEGFGRVCISDQFHQQVNQEALS